INSSPTTSQIFGHMGFRNINGNPVFLMPTGSVGGSARVELPGSLGRYGFPTNSVALKTVQPVLDLIDVGPSAVMFPLILAAMRAPINSLIAADFVIHVYGATGGLKSSVVALIASFFGKFTGNSLPASFNDTTASLEHRAFVARDVVLPVDELVVR